MTFLGCLPVNTPKATTKRPRNSPNSLLAIRSTCRSFCTPSERSWSKYLSVRQILPNLRANQNPPRQAALAELRIMETAERPGVREWIGGGGGGGPPGGGGAAPPGGSAAPGRACRETAARRGVGGGGGGGGGDRSAWPASARASGSASPPARP